MGNVYRYQKNPNKGIVEKRLNAITMRGVERIIISH
jgi:hypothetical protein